MVHFRYVNYISILKRSYLPDKDFAEFQRIARRDKKALLSDQCEERENNRMGKTRDVLKKIRDCRECFRQRWAQ